MREPDAAFMMRVDAHRRTKAQAKRAKDEVLDSECEGAARWEPRRRSGKRVRQTAREEVSRFDTELMGQCRCLLRLTRRVRLN